jgi:SAM-dependent methyltransferase
MADHVTRNRAFWDADADAYQAAHGAALAEEPLAWGAWRAPEADVKLLGPVTGRDILELGCGGAQWAVALHALGARPRALDLSRRQLVHAQRHIEACDAKVDLVQANGEVLPFQDGSFDIVFCDHGALSFCDPTKSVPEVARVLRADGILAFCTTHPLVYLTWDEERQRQTKRFQRGYDELGRIELGEGTSDWVLTPGEWIALLRNNGFEIEALVELRPPKHGTTTYENFVPTKWARHWPAEQAWRARRRRP